MSKKSKVLAVDDNRTNLMLYEELLDTQYALETAENGEAALRKVVEFSPDIILLDIMMPGLSGYDVCKEIRKLPEPFSSTKVILISAKNNTTDRIDGYEAGADDYLIKPFDVEELQARLKVFLKLRSMEEIDRLKSGVMALFSNETRAPLNGIVGPLQLLRASNETNTAEERIKWLNLVHDSARELQVLVEKMMFLSRLRSGQHCLQLCNVSAEKLLSQVASMGKSLSEAREVELLVEDAVSIDLSVDQELIANCLHAILLQSLEFSRSGEKLLLQSRQLDDQVEISFTGCNRRADPQLLGALMDSDSIDMQQLTCNGSMVSLSIAKEVARLHKGSIYAENDEFGTVLSLSLPVSA